MTTITKANLTCPHCGFEHQSEMPIDACQFFYECVQCNTVLRPKEGDCCVFCSYADTRCPMKQSAANETILADEVTCHAAG